jgi:hypothetical protein
MTEIKPITYKLKIGESLTLLAVYTPGGVITTQLDIIISAQARTQNGNEAYDFIYTNQEIDGASLGKYKLTLDTTGMPPGQYRADVKYVLADSSVHFDETFIIDLSYPETRS